MLSYNSVTKQLFKYSIAVILIHSCSMQMMQNVINYKTLFLIVYNGSFEIDWARLNPEKSLTVYFSIIKEIEMIVKTQ